MKWLASLAIWLVAAAAVGQTPLLELEFDGPLAEGQAFVEHAPGEGPVLLPGPFGQCLDLTGSSRAGGLGDEPAAGGSVAVTDPRLDALAQFTVVLWLRPTSERANAARVINKDGSWELMHGGSALAVYLTGAAGKTHYPSERIDRLPDDAWIYFAATVGAESVTTRIGSIVGGLAEPVVKPLAEPLVTTVGLLEVGNFRGIRPFQGKLDKLRVYPEPVDDSAVAAIFAADCASMAASGPFDAVGRVADRPTRFGLPRSSVPFSSRWQRKADEVAGLLQAYGATHLMWVYGAEPDYITRMHAIVPFYEGTLNGMQGYQQSPAALTGEDSTGRQRDLEGRFLQMGHMVAWNPERPHWQGCQNHPDFRTLFFAAADELLAAGADGIHIDDWEFNLSNVLYGKGCFCDGCVAGFREYLKTHLPPAEAAALGIGDLAAFDYPDYLRAHDGVQDAEDYRKRFRELPLTPRFFDFQAAGLREFYLALRAHLAQRSPDKLLPVSVNNQFGRTTPQRGLRGIECVDAIDFFIGEISVQFQEQVDFVMPIKVAEALGMPQVMMNKPQSLGAAQAAMATCYATGSPLRVPWDAYMDNGPEGKPAPRYFGQTADWLPLYRLVADQPALFDDFQTAASVGLVFNGDEPVYDPLREVCERLTALQIPFRLLGSSAHIARVPLESERLAETPLLVALSPAESFAVEDQAAIAAALATRRCRLTDLESAIGRIEGQRSLRPVKVEAPDGISTFLRLAADGRAAVHLVNWNAAPSKQDGDGSGAEQFANVSLSVTRPAGWQGTLTARCWRPGEAMVELSAEVHAASLRFTVPRMGTWAIVELVPGR